MANADLFCAASLEATNGDVEGIPNTLKEAMALGVPVVSTYHAGIPELITHNQEGFLVQENNVDELASALEYMLNERATLGNVLQSQHVKKLNNFSTLINSFYYKQTIMMNC